MQKKSRIILALDITEREKAIKIAEEVKDIVDCIKIGLPTVLSCGMQIISDISKKTEVICDFKVADIPNTNRLIVERAIKNSASGIIVHGFVGKDAVLECVKSAKGKNVFVVVEMSHEGAKDFMQPLTEKLCNLAKEVSATGVIAPATRPDRIAFIRKLIGKMLILSPGIGVQGGKVSDAIKNGADYVIVGRSIYESENPRKVTSEIEEEIRRTLE